jgi:hypothetical protein
MIQLEDDHPVFRSPYKLSFFESNGIKLRCKELLDAEFVELLDGEYACATMMPVKKDTFGYWIEQQMYKGYCLANKKTKLKWYSMQTPKELFNAVRKEKVFSILNSKSKYHQLPLKLQDRVKITYLKVDDDGSFHNPLLLRDPRQVHQFPIHYFLCAF